jgi:hypothetical protein
MDVIDFRTAADKIRGQLVPVNDWVLVRTDPLPEKQGSIFLPQKGLVYTATVLAIGPKVKSDLKKGEKVAFIRWHLEHQQAKQTKEVLEELGADFGLVKERDILFAFDAKEKVEISL